MDDNRIVDLFWERSENAIRETAAKYERYCYAIARNILHNAEDADECVNDTYHGAWNSMPPHRPSVLSTFLGKITRRISLNKWRDNTRDKRGGGEASLALDELADCLSSDNDVERDIETAELAKSIDDFLESLPKIERMVFVCRYWYIDPLSAICRQFGYSESKVKSMLYRTRVKLKLHLERNGLYDN
jgi:RNA polymerase sigma-70 factor (ECF subfamily)